MGCGPPGLSWKAGQGAVGPWSVAYRPATVLLKFNLTSVQLQGATCGCGVHTEQGNLNWYPLSPGDYTGVPSTGQDRRENEEIRGRRGGGRGGGGRGRRDGGRGDEKEKMEEEVEEEEEEEMEGEKIEEEEEEEEM